MILWWLEHGPAAERAEACAFVLMSVANSLLGPDAPRISEGVDDGDSPGPG